MSLPLRTALIVVLAGGVVFAAVRFGSGMQSRDKEEFAFHTVALGTLENKLVERGTLESQSNVKVVSEVEDIRGDGVNGNAILEIVPNGSNVKKGDLLVSLDTGTHIERVDEQILETDRAEAEFIEADVLYKNQMSKNATAVAVAELNVKLAKLDLEMFDDPDKGTYRLQLDEINRLIDDTENQILAAKASLQLSANEREGLESLYRFGYVSKSQLDEVRLKYLQSQSSVAANTNRLQTQLATVKKMNVFERKMQKLTLQGALSTANRTLKQVKLSNDAELSMAKTERDRAERMWTKEKQRLERYQWHLDHCQIYAPQDGMVAYAMPRHSREQKVELGTTVYDGQPILYLPDLKRMQVRTVVHETARTWVRDGLEVTVRLEAMPEKEYRGSIENVELMPDRRNWDESDTKVYKTLVTIDENVDGELKPGMTAIVEIHLESLEDVVTVPVQAVVYEDGSTFCHVRRGGLVERVEVKLGRSNERFVHVAEGLSPGDEVALGASS